MKSTTFAITALAGVASAIPQAAYGVNATTAAATAAAYPTASGTGSTASCEKQYDQCRSVTDPNNPPNFSACAAEYSACLGYNPFASNGTNTVTPQATSPGAYVTQIVTSLETYCPSPTTLTYNSKTYTVTEPTTLTVTDCPCKHTVPATELPPAKTVTAVVSSFTTVCPSPTVFTTKSKTYTVTSATTLTITHCPGGCTVTTPASYVCPTTTPVKPAPSSSAPPAYKPSGSMASAASKPPVTVTKMVSSYTTYCPAPTTFTVKGSTYSVTSATTLTITHCPGGCPVATTVPAAKPSAPASMPSQAAPKPSQPAAAPSQPAAAPSQPAAQPSAQAPPAGSPAPSAPASPVQPTGSGRPVTQIS